MTATSPLKFRQTKSGEWVAFGPAHSVRVGSVEIVKASGERVSRRVVRVGREFAVDGVPCAYGYLADATTSSRSSHAHGSWYPGRGGRNCCGCDKCMCFDCGGDM